MAFDFEIDNDRLSDNKVKALLLGFFNEKRQQPVPPGNPTGKSPYDPDIVPFCDWLNQFDGVCTLQSCAGHKPRDGNPYFDQAHLWVWLDDQIIERLLPLLNDAVKPPIDKISICRQPWGKYVSIVFKGNECDQLDVSLIALESLFTTILQN